MLQIVLLLLLMTTATFILLRQFSGKLVATPYAHMLYFLFVTFIGGFLLAGQYGLMFPYYIAFVGFITAMAALAGYAIMTLDVRGIGDAVYRFSGGRTEQILDDRFLKISVGVLIALTVGVSLIFYQGLPPPVMSLAGLLTGDVSLNALLEVRDSRFELTKSAYFGGEYRGQGVMRLVIFSTCSLICAYFFARVANRRSFGRIVGAGFAMFFSWAFVGGVGDRAPFLETMIIGVTAYTLCRPVKPRAVGLLVLAFFALLIFTSLYSTKSLVLVQEGVGSGLSQLLTANVERAVVGNSINDARVVELVQAGRWDLRLGGVHFRNFVTAIPGVNYGVPVAYELFAYFNPYSSGTTFFSGTYLTAAYLDFGLFGAIGLYLLIGIAVGITERTLFLRRKLTGLQFMFVPVLSFITAKLVIYGPTGWLTSVGMLAAIFLILLFLDYALRALGERQQVPMLVGQ